VFVLLFVVDMVDSVLIDVDWIWIEIVVTLRPELMVEGKT
jgi:hypothetical protein